MRSRKGRPIDLPHRATESQLHVSVAQFLDWALVPPTFYTTFPAGWGKLTKGTAGRLYASGLKKGMPDILIFADPQISENRRRPHVIGIELKVPPNSVTAAQRDTFAKLQAVGVRVYVCTSIEEVRVVLKREWIPCRLGTKENGQQLVLPMEQNSAAP